MNKLKMMKADIDSTLIYKSIVYLFFTVHYAQ